MNNSESRRKHWRHAKSRRLRLKRQAAAGLLEELRSTAGRLRVLEWLYNRRLIVPYDVRKTRIEDAMLRICFGSLVGLWAASCLAATPIPDEGAPPIVFCYWLHSIQAGFRKCDPPAMLVGSVFGACSNYEDQVRQQVLDDPTKSAAPWEREEVAKIAIRSIHERMSTQVQGWILDAQVSDQSICKTPH